MTCKLRSLYLCVENMSRAIDFYETLLNQPVTVRDPVYSVFDIGGFRLGLFAYKTQKEMHTYGSNCLPSIEFENLAQLNQKLSGKKMVFPLQRIGPMWVSECEDSEGNHIELTAPWNEEVKL